MEFFIAAFVTLFVTVDPIGNVPLFLSITDGATTAERRTTAIKGIIVAFVMLVLFIFVGKSILTSLGISLPAFRIAGGLLLFVIAFEMLFAKRRERRTDQAEKLTSEAKFEDVSIFPLAFPLLAGPGTIASVLLLSAQTGGQTSQLMLLVGVAALVLLIALAMFMFAAVMIDYIPSTLIDMLTRLLGLLLAALAVQFVVDGITNLVVGSAIL
ncbi:MAG: MarC family protein [Alphaproteobacteria bacterium]